MAQKSHLSCTWSTILSASELYWSWWHFNQTHLNFWHFSWRNLSFDQNPIRKFSALNAMPQANVTANTKHNFIFQFFIDVKNYPVVRYFENDFWYQRAIVLYIGALTCKNSCKNSSPGMLKLIYEFWFICTPWMQLEFENNSIHSRISPLYFHQNSMPSLAFFEHEKCK